MPRVSVESLGGAVYRVVVTQGRSTTTHEVTVTPEHLARYAPGSTPERLLEASFEFAHWDMLREATGDLSF